MNRHATAGDSPATSDKRVLVQLRRMILDGRLAAGDRISEVSVAAMFDVSRTPARLALRTLEVEGLIRKRQGRGFTVETFDLGDIRRAYEVRGVLEGLAAGTLARAGLTEETGARLAAAVERMDHVLNAAEPVSMRVSRYQDANTLFHDTILAACGNDYVGFALGRLAGLPMLQPGTLVFNADRPEAELMRLRFGNMQHRLILDALRGQDARRAETLMREHANQTVIYAQLFAGGQADA